MDTGNYSMVATAFEKARIANDQYNDYCDYVQENGDEWNVPLLDWLRDNANKADRELEAARDAELNTCTCRPDSVEACPVCKARIREHYGDTIPFDGR